ncbi:MAG: hypothetical protein Q7J31_18870 [Syntrophales bacterium]|nr:hypothetical protein [Syntrophales bacterium]
MKRTETNDGLRFANPPYILIDDYDDNMKKRLARKDNIRLLQQKILIIKLQYVGDTMGVIPTVANLKKHAPGLTVDVPS